MDTSFEASATDDGFHDATFVGNLARKFGDILANRMAWGVFTPIGAQSAAEFTFEQLSFCESCPLWNSPAHADQLYELRNCIARALGLSIADYDSDLSSGVLVDFVLDTLAFAVREAFSDVQIVALLLCALQTHRDVCDAPFPPDAPGEDTGAYDDDAIEGPVARRLTKRLQLLTSRNPTSCVELKTVTDVTYEEQVDPAAYAAWEAKRDPKANKKAMLAHEELLKSLPKVKVEVTTERVVEVEGMVDMGPVFSFVDAAQICAHLSETLLTHWRLYRYCARVPRQQLVKEVRVEVQDVPAAFIPPLSKALTQREYKQYCERQELWAQAEAAVQQAFTTYFTVPMTLLYETANGEVAERNRRRAALDRADQDAALPQVEFTKTVDVLGKRILKKTAKNVVSAADIREAQRQPQQPLTESSPSPPQLDSRSSQRQSMAKLIPPAIDTIQDASIHGSSGDAAAIGSQFDYVDVDARLDALGEAVARVVAASGPSGKSSRK